VDVTLVTQAQIVDNIKLDRRETGYKDVTLIQLDQHLVQN
jgi:hypothetical protein